MRRSRRGRRQEPVEASPRSASPGVSRPLLRRTTGARARCFGRRAHPREPRRPPKTGRARSRHLADQIESQIVRDLRPASSVDRVEQRKRMSMQSRELRSPASRLLPQPSTSSRVGVACGPPRGTENGGGRSWLRRLVERLGAARVITPGPHSIDLPPRFVALKGDASCGRTRTSVARPRGKSGWKSSGCRPRDVMRRDRTGSGRRTAPTILNFASRSGDSPRSSSRSGQMWKLIRVEKQPPDVIVVLPAEISATTPSSAGEGPRRSARRDKAAGQDRTRRTGPVDGLVDCRCRPGGTRSQP